MDKFILLECIGGASERVRINSINSYGLEEKDVPINGNEYVEGIDKELKFERIRSCSILMQHGKVDEICPEEIDKLDALFLTTQQKKEKKAKKLKK